MKVLRHVPLEGLTPWERPAPKDRAARSEAIERRIRRAANRIAHPDLRRLFENTLPNTLDTTIIAGGSDESHDLWGLVLEAARLDEVADQAIRTLELSVVAKYAFALAQQFNGFYHAYPILKEERADVRLWRAAAVAYYRQQLTRALDLMGCSVPDRM